MQTNTRTAPAALVHSGKLNSADSNALKIAQFVGAEIASVAFDDEITARVLVLSAETLVNLGPERLGRIRKSGSNVFVYGFKPTNEHRALLGTFGMRGVRNLTADEREFSIEESARDICRQLAGLSFGRTTEMDLGFVCDANESIRALISVGRQPVLVTFQENGCEWMLSACGEIADLDQVAEPDASILSLFSSVAPLMMFLRRALGSRVWHNDDPSACLIIDDPLLQPCYGFLDYATLGEIVSAERFSATIAFIPWNFRRSDPGVANLFASNSERLSICIHGCDHTAAEFGSQDYETLRAKASLALKRMNKHRELTGVGFDRVMVFPQGIFSAAAPKALRACGYVAAVNSTPHAVDPYEGLRLRDVLDIANTRHGNFPIFSRRHPASVAEIAFDLFLGKPALLVVHHDYFRQGLRGIVEELRRVNALDPELKWRSLGPICASARQKRMDENGVLQTRSVTEGMKPVSEIEQTADLPEPPLYKAKVLVRRRLCEFRDNYVDRSPVLSRSLGKAWNLVFGAGGMQG